ncbi:MAG: DMT family transporter [Candidatus Lambdaproteobacteria bacterium]|nr:DMT family transporter [Candidatus Lambdaproteobacteria bacterium]
MTGVPHLPAGATATDPEPEATEPGGARPAEPAPVLWMLGLTSMWGLNTVSIKVLTAGISPLTATGLRALIALGVLTLFGRLRRERLGYARAEWRHGAVIALFHTLQFVLMYTGSIYTTGGRFAILLNVSPLLVAIGAHYFLLGDRLTPPRGFGLILAFGGVALLFREDLLRGAGGGGGGTTRGDLMVLASAAVWAANAVYIKRYLAQRLTGFRIVYVQVLLSTPAFLLPALLYERNPFHDVDWLTLANLLFQGAFITPFTYMMFLVLLRRHSASKLQSFTFLTPIWGVFFSALLLGEAVTFDAVGALALVGSGLYLVTRRGGPRARRRD